MQKMLVAPNFEIKKKYKRQIVLLVSKIIASGRVIHNKRTKAQVRIPWHKIQTLISLPLTRQLVQLHNYVEAKIHPKAY